jgi:hypothetical protein
MITADPITRPARAGSQISADRYSSRIIKAGALLADTKTLLAHWDLKASARDNLDRIRRENTFGKASRSRVEDILAVFRQRYLVDQEIIKALVVLAQKRLPAASLDLILYFHATQSDRLLRDVVAEWLVPLQGRGVTELGVDELKRHLAKWVAQGKTTGEWSEITTLRVAQGLLSTLRDFGVLQGTVVKRIAPIYVPITVFAYVMLYLKRHQPSGTRLIEHPDWRLFYLTREGVERSLFEAHQDGLLEYHAAGSVTRLTFPADTLEEYAHVLADRAR